jgi:AraC-like DNA-binding protein
MLDELNLPENESCLGELCDCLICLLMRERGEILIRDEERYSRIREAIMYLENHFTESPTLNDVATRVGLHPHYFSDLFHKVTGESFCEHLNSLRIGYAKTLLSKGYSVSEACYGSGFGSISNFLYRFKKSTGLSPKQFKAQS